jgi:hypothetical protein
MRPRTHALRVQRDGARRAARPPRPAWTYLGQAREVYDGGIAG